ncbi:conserved hypothetical protein [Nitrospina gracilis 3/211]|uniref:Uncharacterized protein n=1 Tax=Nitrospina gracilis (strain 3/211) TaxID=1266370 RepID=M1YI83_NITG3|nr:MULTISPECIES: hypothetical protein [Nitrospina]MCF8723124.1 hypothetical protein [Nitrospina sp. Nb-3]CCQ90166.1 conserved hypothetical protein [Nitrospina gracilis 3/211]
MEDTIQNILNKIKELEGQLQQEIETRQEKFYYHIKRKRVYFEKQVREQHKLLMKTIYRYLHDARIMPVVTAPVIYSLIIPAVLMDMMVSAYQAICFPVYGVPKVKRSDYIVIDRHYLRYLNGIEKFNCMYCGYFNGLVAYVREIAARTEQHWCPIKHARKVKDLHNRYKYFLDYGDGNSYREHIEKVRRDYSDLE